MVCGDSFHTIPANLVGSVHDFLLGDVVVPHVHHELEELLPIVLEDAVIDDLHARWHLVERLRVLNGRSLLHEGRYIVIDIHFPFVLAITSYVLCNYLVGHVEDDCLLTVYPCNHGFSGKVVGNRVMIGLDINGRLLVNLVLSELIASDFPRIGLESRCLLFQHPGLILSSGTAALCIHVYADLPKPVASLLDVIGVNPGGKGAASYIVYATLNVALLPARSGIAETPFKLVERAQALECRRGPVESLQMGIVG